MNHLKDVAVAKYKPTGKGQKALTELRKYVNADLFPESDFKKFDETSLEKYPQGFYSVQEMPWVMQINY